MKRLLMDVTPGVVILAIPVLAWATDAPPRHSQTIVYGVGIVILLIQRHLRRRREEELARELKESQDRELSTYVYARKIFNAQTTAIARLQAGAHRRRTP